MRLRLPKAARLFRAHEFARLRKDGATQRGRYLILSVLATGPETELTRLGVITSRRVGLAVARNRVRRRLRELFRTMRPQLRGGFWLVAIARQAAAGASFEALRDEWVRLVRRAQIFLPACAS